MTGDTIRGRLRRARTSKILAPFASLVGAQVIGSGLGFVFWVLVARHLEPSWVGIAAAVISAQSLLGTVATLGLGTLLLGEVQLLAPRQQRHLLVTGLGFSALAGAALGLVTVVVTPLLSHGLRLAFGNPWVVTMYVAGTAATAAALVLDQCVLGLGKARLQLWRNLIASILRFPLFALLMSLGASGAWTVVVSWVVPLVISLAFIWRALRMPNSRRSPEERWGEQVRTHARLALHNHALNMSLAAGPLLVPVVGAMVLAPHENAQFMIAWLMASFVFIPPYMLATALFAAQVNESVEAFRASARRTLPAALALSALLCLATWTLSPWLLGIFGGHYVDNSVRLLDLLVLGGLWMVVKDHMVVYARVSGRLVGATQLAICSVLLEVLGAVIGGVQAGPLGLTVGWLSVLALEALVTLPLAWRILLRPRRAEPRHAARALRKGSLK